MLQSLAGDERAYRSLLEQAGTLLRGYYLRRLQDRAAADDLVQESLIALHTRRMTYDTARPFTAWLHAIARYKLVDHLRAGRRHVALPLDETPEALFAAGNAEGAGDAHDIERALQEVPAAQAAMIRAVKLEGRSIAEVSARTGLSPSAVKVTIHRALRRLGRRFGGEGEA